MSESNNKRQWRWRERRWSCWEITKLKCTAREGSRVIDRISRGCFRTSFREPDSCRGTPAGVAHPAPSLPDILCFISHRKANNLDKEPSVIYIQQSVMAGSWLKQPPLFVGIIIRFCITHNDWHAVCLRVVVRGLVQACAFIFPSASVDFGYN